MVTHLCWVTLLLLPVAKTSIRLQLPQISGVPGGRGGGQNRVVTVDVV